MQTLSDSTIQDFAASVRLELRDLPKSVVDELTGDLEASLQERRQDEGEDFQLQSPNEYAAELREAAGVSPKPSRTRAFSSRSFVASVEAWFSKSPVTRSMLEFGISIRPLWWVLRALFAWVLIGGLLSSTTSALVLVAFALLSIQWGRKKWFTSRFFAALLLPLNLLAIFVSPIATSAIGQRIESFYAAEDLLQMWPATDGLRMDGNPVTEIQAFSKDGTEVKDLTFTIQPGGISFPVNDETPVYLPNIIGMSLFEANMALQEAGIESVDYLRINNVTDQEAVVRATDPSAPGDLIPAGTPVIVTLDKK
jgi:hypothetical protein